MVRAVENWRKGRKGGKEGREGGRGGKEKRVGERVFIYLTVDLRESNRLQNQGREGRKVRACVSKVGR